MTETKLQKENSKEMKLPKKDPKKNNTRWFTSHKEIKTREDLQDLLNSFFVKERLTKMLSSIGEMTNLAVIIRKDIEAFEKGEELDKEKLGKDIAQLRFLKHQLGTITFGKFQELLTGKVDDYVKSRKKRPDTTKLNEAEK